MCNQKFPKCFLTWLCSRKELGLCYKGNLGSVLKLKIASYFAFQVTSQGSVLKRSMWLFCIDDPKLFACVYLECVLSNTEMSLSLRGTTKYCRVVPDANLASLNASKYQF